MFFLPLGIEGGTVRFPLIGLLILLTCLGVFAATGSGEVAIDREAVKTTLQYWEERPYLDFPERFEHTFVPPNLHSELERLRSQWLARNRLPSEAQVADEQVELNRLAEAAMVSVDHSLFRRLALIPARGFAQLGWLTHMFEHGGWLHLIGNMLFLYAVSLLLEDAWGRGLFLTFYLVGGLVAALAHYSLDPTSVVPMIGASGAVSACIGAATVRFGTRRMRIGYLLFLGIYLKRGTFTIPVWVWGGLKAASEVFDLVTGSAQGVAVAAHVGGLAFGAVVALAMKGLGFDRVFVATDEVVGPLTMSVLAEVEQAQQALQRGDRVEARRLYEQALKAHPHDTDAEWGLLELDLLEGNRVRAAQRLERGVQALTRDNQRDRANSLFLDVLPRFQTSDLRPAFAFQMARAIDGRQTDPARLRQLYRRAGDELSGTAGRALIRAAELGLEANEFDDVQGALERARSQSLSREDSARVTELEERLEAARRLRRVALDQGPDLADRSQLPGRLDSTPRALSAAGELELDHRARDGFARSEAVISGSGLSLDYERSSMPAPNAEDDSSLLDLAAPQAEPTTDLELKLPDAVRRGPRAELISEIDLPIPAKASLGSPIAPGLEVPARSNAARAESPAPPPAQPVAAPRPPAKLDMTAVTTFPQLTRERRVRAAALMAAKADSLTLVMPGDPPQTVLLTDIKAMGLGVVMQGEQGVMTLLLVLSVGSEQGLGAPTIAVRIDSNSGGVERMRPQVPAREAWRQFVGWLLSRTTTPCFPSRERIGSEQLGRYPDAHSFEDAFFSS